MVRILHISDLHFGRPFRALVGRELLSIGATLSPNAIVVSGDLTQRARPSEFRAARSFLDQLPPVPRLVVPGNHDVPLYRLWERLRCPHREYRKHICDSLSPVLHLPGVLIVGLDSTSPWGSISNGRVSLRQLEHCCSRLREGTGEILRMVAIHHHFVPAPNRRWNRHMQKTRRAIEFLQAAGVQVILGGHLHRSYIGNSLDFFPSETGEQGIIIVHAGTATSGRGLGREQGKNTFNCLDVGPEMIRVTHWMFSDETRRFAPLSQHVFPRPGMPFDKFLENDDERKTTGGEKNATVPCVQQDGRSFRADQ